MKRRASSLAPLFPLLGLFSLACRGLSGGDDQRLIAALRSDDEKRRLAAIETCARKGAAAAGAIPALVDIMEKGPTLQLGARMALQNMGAQAFPAAARLRQHPNALVRAEFIALAAKLQEKGSLPFDELFPVASAGAQDPDEGVRSMALSAFHWAREHPDSVIPILEAGLRDPSARVRGNAAGALAGYSKAKDAGALVPLLLNALIDPDPTLRRQASQTLASFPLTEFGPPDWLGALSEGEARARLGDFGLKHAELLDVQMNHDVLGVLMLLKAGAKPDEKVLRVAANVHLQDRRSSTRYAAQAVLNASRR